MNRYFETGSISQQSSRELQTYMAQVYGWMTCGLILTSCVAWLTAHKPILTEFILNDRNTVLGLIAIQLFLTCLISNSITKLSGAATTGMFMLYSMITGLVMSHIFLVYSSLSIAIIFCVAATMFGLMSLYGYTTNRDLSNFNNILLMALIGVLVASLINFLLKSSMLMWLITYISTLLFVALTAYDTQKIKILGNQVDINDSENLRCISILGAFTIYLDFINLFTVLLRIGGDRNKQL
ncbi:Bax inhibitor-1/YccA family protein [Candidatus Pantoea edessiphila]|uniref:Inner membrane protein YbhL n=1 Tax=Candidatus Pantoea edessiphila TaxID=2044610 RepID=A0A2P5SX56_9GAMM|nr:Bax inhibitor-1/YccA family protein [Candidatus Pantoea edessiphila]PPI86893.1 hypothetical protein CRV10_01405 [Candidatus Pantoea edessiphila]